MTDLRLDVLRQDTTLLMEVVGDVDLDTAEQLTAAIDGAIASAGIEHLIIDLARVPFLDSAGIRILIHGQRHALEHGKTLVVINPQRLVARVLRLTGVLTLLTEKTAAPA